MSTGTNKERLEQNNIKLEEIKGKIDKLPEYQDIEPVYAVTDFCTVKLNHPIYGETMSTADYFVYETWVLARFNAQSMAENSIFRIVNGEAEFVADVTFTDMSSITRVFSFGCIFKFENNKLYIFKQIGETTSSTRLFYSFDITTKELSKLNLTCSWLYRPMWCYNGNILSTSDSQQLVLYDPINGNEQRYYPAKNSNNYNSIPSNQYANVLNMYLRIVKSGNTAYFSLYGKDVTDIYTYNGTPCFITNDNVICLSTKSGYRCYNLNANHTLGTEVNLDCSALSGTNFLVLNDKYILSSDNGKLYEYTSTGFLLVQTFPSSNTYYRFGTINANGYLYIFNRGTKIVGYIYDDAYINNKIPFIASSSNVLQGVNLINQDYTLLTGTMPNNGELNYTPSTEEQTIPAGYTSGGTVAGDSNLVANNIRLGTTIFGVEGNLEADKPDQTKTVTPTIEEQVITPDTGYELASVTVAAVTSDIDSNIVAENIKKDVSILGVKGTYEGSGGGSSDYNVKLVPTDGRITDYITEISTQLDTSNVTNMSYLFSGCTNLTTIPLLDTSKVTNMQYMFDDCINLTDESLNNILMMCKNATSYTDTKTLKYLGLISAQANKCKTLSNYQAFLNAGWTTGY